MLPIARVMQQLQTANSAREAARALGLHPTTLQRVCTRLGGELARSYQAAVARGNAAKAYNLPER